MYDYYHGDDLLKAVKQYDPNAKWTTTTLGGGEGGEGGTGKRLDYDPRIMAQLLAGGQ
jgi:hypothetical protein